MQGVPTTQTCLVQGEAGDGTATLARSHPVPALTKPHDVLVRVAAVALNPTDYRMPLADPLPGAVMGCDFAGTVVAAGADVPADLLHTRVCGLVHGSSPTTPANGAFAEYVRADARLLLRLPDAWSDEAGAALGGTGWLTAGLTLYDALGLPGTPSRPAPTRDDGTPTPVLVYGAATATGTMMCQILSQCAPAPPPPA